MQYVLIFIALTAFWLSIRKRSYSAKFIILILSFLWLWMGIVYHLLFFTVINKAAFVFGSLFIIQGILFFIMSWKNSLSFGFRKDIYFLTGIILIIFSLIVYPVIGYFSGHVYPSSPSFGLPCPTTIFTFGILLLMTKKCPIYLLIIPFLWSIIGFAAAFSLGIKEDTGLLIAGVVSSILVVNKNKSIKLFKLA